MRDGTNQWHNINEIYNVYIYRSTNILNDLRKVTHPSSLYSVSQQILLPTHLCRRPLAHLDQGEDANGVTYTVFTPSQQCLSTERTRKNCPRSRPDRRHEPDPWPWRAMIMTYSRAKVQGQWSVGSKDRQMDRQTDRGYCFTSLTNAVGKNAVINTVMTVTVRSLRRE